MLLFISLPLWTGLLLSLGVIGSLIYTLNRHVLMRSKNAITNLTWNGNGDWVLFTRDGKSLNARLQKSTYLHARLVILNFKIGNRNQSLVLLSDNLDPETFRRLRVRLQLEKYKMEN